MRTHLANYQKIWWFYGALLGGISAFATFLIHGWMQTIGTSLDPGPFFSIELIPLLGVSTVIAALYLPILFLSDVISKRSHTASLLTAIGFSIVLATLILLKWHFEFGEGLILRGWNVYLYALIMGACCFYGWQRSKVTVR